MPQLPSNNPSSHLYNQLFKTRFKYYKDTLLEKVSYMKTYFICQIKEGLKELKLWIKTYLNEWHTHEIFFSLPFSQIRLKSKGAQNFNSLLYSVKEKVNFPLLFSFPPPPDILVNWRHKLSPLSIFVPIQAFSFLYTQMFPLSLCLYLFAVLYSLNDGPR